MDTKLPKRFRQCFGLLGERVLRDHRISIASPILTGVGMPVWKAAKMRAFSKRKSATGFVWNSAFASKECLYLCSKKAPCRAFLFGIVPHIFILTDAYR